jgi:hypothetical protein
VGTDGRTNGRQQWAPTPGSPDGRKCFWRLFRPKNLGSFWGKSSFFLFFFFFFSSINLTHSPAKFKEIFAQIFNILL